MLQVQVDASELSGFSVAAPEVIQHYKYKNMKAALANIPAGKDIGGSVSTKVTLAKLAGLQLLQPCKWYGRILSCSAQHKATACAHGMQHASPYCEGFWSACAHVLRCLRVPAGAWWGTQSMTPLVILTLFMC